MKTITVRELSGYTIEERANSGDLVGIKRNRRFIAVVVPMARVWIEHLIDHNWARVLHSVDLIERTAADENDVIVLDDLLNELDSDSAEQTSHALSTPSKDPEDSSRGRLHTESARSAAADALGYLGSGASRGATDALAQLSPAAAEMVRRFAAVLGLEREDADGRIVASSATIRIRDLNARRIEEAEERRELLILTRETRPIGFVVPASRELVEFLLYQNLSRVVYNVERLEKTGARGVPIQLIGDSL